MDNEMVEYVHSAEDGLLCIYIVDHDIILNIQNEG